MSAKGLALTLFYNTMDSNTTTYVLCGLAVIVFWNFFSKYVVKSSNSKRPAAAEREERNGQAVTTTSSVDDATEVEGEDAPKRNCIIGNGVAGRTKSEEANNQEDFLELRSSKNQGPERSGSKPEGPLCAAEVDGGCPRAAQEETRWKGEGPHVAHLLENGWTEEDLDKLQCPIEVYAWFAHLQSCGCNFELAVILQDKRKKRITEYLHSSEPYKPTTNIYKRVSLIFENYGSGVRYVTYSHRRRKPTGKECKGHCGSEMYSGLKKQLKINSLK